jgi:hypothetical protein
MSATARVFLKCIGYAQTKDISRKLTLRYLGLHLHSSIPHPYMPDLPISSIGRRAGSTTVTAPKPISATAASRPTQIPTGRDFSAKIKSVMTTMTATFITPRGKRIRNSSQQQPTQ